MPSIQVSVGSVTGGIMALHASLWNQYYNQNNTSNQYRDEIDMLLKTDDGDVIWDELYSSALSDIQKLKEFSNATETYDPRLNLIAVALESYTFQIIYDAFGMAPYSEAFQGETTGNFNPKFERGEEIYPILVTKIDEALNLFNSYLDENPNANELRLDQRNKDYFFNGDITAWVQFANSVKLKLAMRNLEYDTDWSMGIINALEANPNYIGTDVLLDIFSAEINKENPLYAQDQNLNTQINLVANRTFSEFLTVNGDPRDSLIYEANSAGNNLL
ncbi:MAG: SusD/RagB family nutrient-binding outer membrane lipoprotein [Bacteroidales bacterium]|nr:SusD/RagB family nutrient-binding outer membrane lipoprotein [Bacteroidales bacterium]